MTKIKKDIDEGSRMVPLPRYESLQLKYGQQQARNGVLMQALAYMARHYDQPKAKEFMERADEAMKRVKLSDMVIARTYDTKHCYTYKDKF